MAGSLRTDDDTTTLPIPVITFTSSNLSESFLSDFLFDDLPTVGSDTSLGDQWVGVEVSSHYIELDFEATVLTDCFG